MKTTLRLTVIGAVIVLGAALQSQHAHAQSVLSRLLSSLGITDVPGQVRSGGETASGDVMLWGGGAEPAQPLTTAGGYRSPVFGRKGEALALKGDTLVSIALAGGAMRELRALPGAIKLLGVNKDNPDELYVLLKHNGVLGLAAATRGGNTLTALSLDAATHKDQAQLAALQDDARDYGTTRLFLTTQSKRGITGRSVEWTDVFVSRGNAAAQNVSRCDGRNCVQPALDLVTGQVLYLRHAP
ncbi:MAG: hypothetical protein FJY56_02615 [Betaproteobacteria bacterium]|nr:hypothetical protein [Betaproteobacteria bacterium]